LSKRTTNLAKLVKARRQALGLTQHSLAQRVGIETSYVALIESGSRKPSLNLIIRLADALGLGRQEVFFLAHPEARAFLSRTGPEKRSKTSPSWRRFTKNSALLARYHVTSHELQVLEHLSLLGTAISIKEFLAILTLIRDIPPRK
jgi:transcriptional regulator with XRE-family HTH domain